MQIYAIKDNKDMRSLLPSLSYKKGYVSPFFHQSNYIYPFLSYGVFLSPKVKAYYIISVL